MTQKLHNDSPGIREIVLVMGMTGWGKSWWTKLYSQTYNRKLVYDPSISFPVDNLVIHKREGGLTEPEYVGTMDQIVDDVLSEETKVFNLGFENPDDIPAAAGALFVKGNNILILEELATVFEKGQARLPEWGKRHVFYGRHASCGMVLIAQRPTYIPIDFRSQANRVITFCQHEGADMDWLQDFYGKERMKRLAEIPKFTCFDYHNGVVKEYSIIEKVKHAFGVKLDISIQSHLDLVL